jgi:hypothetical protein
MNRGETERSGTKHLAGDGRYCPAASEGAGARPPRWQRKVRWLIDYVID